MHLILEEIFNKEILLLSKNVPAQIFLSELFELSQIFLIPVIVNVNV